MSRGPLSSIARDFVLTAGTNIGLTLLGVLTGVIAARLLGPQGRGELAAIQVLPSILLVFSSLGMLEAVAYQTARDPTNTRGILFTALAMSLCVSLPTVIIGQALVGRVMRAYPAATMHAAVLYLLFVPIGVIAGPTFGVLLGLRRLGLWNALRWQAPVSWLAVLGVAWGLGRSDAGIVATLYLVALVFAVLVALSAVLATNRGRVVVDRRHGQMLLSYGIPTMLASLPAQVTARLDQLFMAALLPPTALGLYAVASSWGTITAPILTAVGTIVFPRLAALDHADQRRDAAVRTVRTTFLLAVAVMACAIVATPICLPLLFGAEFKGAVIPALILVASGGVTSTNSVLSDTVRGLGEPRIPMIAHAIGLAATGLLLWLFLVPYGLLGAAAVSLASSCIVALLLTCGVVWITKSPFRTAVLPETSDVKFLWSSMERFWGGLWGLLAPYNVSAVVRYRGDKS